MGVGSSTMSTWAKKNVFERVTQLLRSPNIKKPAWYDAAVAVPPPRKAFQITQACAHAVQRGSAVAHFLSENRRRFVQIHSHARGERRWSCCCFRSSSTGAHGH